MNVYVQTLTRDIKDPVPVYQSFRSYAPSPGPSAVTTERRVIQVRNRSGCPTLDKEKEHGDTYNPEKELLV